MLVTVGIWFLLLFTSTSLGLTLNFFIYRQHSEIICLKNHNPMIISFLGLSFITTLSCFISIFHRLSFEVLIVILLLSSLNIRNTWRFILKQFAIIHASNKKIKFIFLLLWFVYFLLILVQSTKEPFVTDTGLYHSQTIQWAEKFHVVKGLGNLHGRLAFNSTFHLLCATFAMSFLSLGSLYNTVQSFMLLVFGTYLIHGVVSRSNPSNKFIYSGSLLLIIIFYRDWVSSPTPDIPTTLFILTIFMIFLNHNLNIGLYTIILILSLTVVTLKISAIPILIVPFLLLVILIKRQKTLTPIYISILLSFLIICPWLIRNIILSGYLLYPFPYIDIFDFHWKIPLSNVLQEKNWIHVFARIGSYDINTFNQLSFRDWFSIWFSSRNIVEKIIFITLCSSPIIGLVSSRNLKKNPELKKRFFIYMGSFIGVIFWFYMAPYFRFGHGFIIIAFLSIIDIITFKYLNKMSKISSILLFGFLFYSLYREITEVRHDFSQIICLPQPHPKTNYSEQKINGLKIKVPVNGILCWDTCIPCAPVVNRKLKPYGKNPSSGFYILKNN